MSEQWMLITEKAKAKLRIGELIGTWTPPGEHAVITDKWVKLFALSLRDANPLWFDDAYAASEGSFAGRVAPSAFCVVFNPMEHGYCPASAFWAEISGQPDDGRHGGGLAAYNRFECHRPFRLGDRIKCEVRNLGCYEKVGRAGLIVCVETEYRMMDQRGECVAVGVYGRFTQFPLPATAKRPN